MNRYIDNVEFNYFFRYVGVKLNGKCNLFTFVFILFVNKDDDPTHNPMMVVVFVKGFSTMVTIYLDDRLCIISFVNFHRNLSKNSNKVGFFVDII